MQDSIKTAVILAAGEGKRLKELGTKFPKGFLTFGEISIIEESIIKLIESRIEDVTKIWFENTAQFFRPIPNDTISVIHDNLSKTREFLTKNIADFLAQYNESSKKNERGGAS